MLSASNVFTQSIDVTLSLETPTTKTMGAVLVLKTTIENHGSRKLYFNNFIKSVAIERLDTITNEYKDVFNEWFAVTSHDPNYALNSRELGLPVDERNYARDEMFADELASRNRDSIEPKYIFQWVSHQVRRIETLQANGRTEFFTYLNSLPPGNYRVKFLYSTANGQETISPVEKFKNAIFPEVLCGYSRFVGTIESDYLNFKK